MFPNQVLEKQEGLHQEVLQFNGDMRRICVYLIKADADTENSLAVKMESMLECIVLLHESYLNMNMCLHRVYSMYELTTRSVVPPKVSMYLAQ